MTFLVEWIFALFVAGKLQENREWKRTRSDAEKREYRQDMLIFSIILGAIVLGMMLTR